ncbi:MAG: Pyruvate formate-lyase 1-activating enzyme [Candidatus Anoxychlamydiales bacterium]|nr:Pyruvate formate-lyase 1-activating enzyme [Candidatus Anoxychlamydiales bacterium]NGX52135.1 Pyruvate formate-lyase 1-activating enzyme [Candidatus Anoxychlamydiales bacterium]
MLIGGLLKFSLINYPKKAAAVIFTQGCSFFCHYCHNPELVLKDEFNTPLEIETIFSFLEKRQGKLDAVVISGGEPTLQKNLIDFIKRVKNLNFLVKLDTNGVNPKVLKDLISQNLIDYIAMDLKAPLDKYPKITNVNLSSKRIEESIKIIMSSNIDYEFRSTLVKNLHEKEDIEKMAFSIKDAKLYVLQKFVPKVTLNPTYSKKTAFSDEEMDHFQKTSLNYVKKCFVR